MYADNFLRLNDFDYFLDCVAVGMTRGVNVYFQFGHSPLLLENKWFKRLFSNAIEWSLDSKHAK